MQELGKILVVLGMAAVVIGLFLWKTGIPLGRLPGDFLVQKSNMSFYFPLTTCLILSAILTLVMWLVRR